MSSVSLTGVTKFFGQNKIVDDISLEIADGSFTVLLGPSGCGKTTTLNMICGLEPATSGTIRFGDKEVQHLDPAKRDVAMVFQSYALYPNRSVAENISFSLKLRKLDKAEIKKRVDEAAEMLSISALLDRRPRELSGGQQQRVALARAIVRRPNVFLLDEPLSNLDAKLRAEMRLSLRDLQRQLGGTFIYVTHDQGEAMSMADTVVVMNDGVIQQAAPPLDVYRNPANRFVAGFVGTPSMNFITGDLSGGTFRRGDWQVQVPATDDHTDVTLGVRPENVELSPDDNGSWKVRFVEQLGTEALVLLADLDQGHSFVARCDPDVDLQQDQRVAVSVAPEKAYLFDADGARLGRTA